MEAAKDAGVTVVSLPLVNQWTQVIHLKLLGYQKSTFVRKTFLFIQEGHRFLATCVSIMDS